MAKTSKKSTSAPTAPASPAEPADATQNGTSEQKLNSNDAPTSAKPPRKRATTARKSAAAGTPRKPSTRKKPAPAEATISDDDVRLRAYYLAEQRIRDGLAGDSHADWLEARRQLLAEATGHA